MAKSGYTLEPIQTAPGVQPVTDNTPVSTKNYTYADKVRWQNGVAEKIGGYMTQTFDYDQTIDGVVRTVFTDVINGQFYTVIGSNEKLYSLIGSRLTNITPFQTSSVAVANSLDTHYDTLGADPFATTNGSPVVTVTDADAANYEPGDIIDFTGATGFAGLAAGDLNSDHIVRTVGVGSYTINVGVNANATTTGGGAAVDRTSGLITVNDAAHGQLDGDRVNISGAADTGGILAADINQEFIIRNVGVNSFDVMTDGTATSSVTAGGGAATVYFPEIADGLVNQTATQGYGAGLYGVGLYGTALVSGSGISYPRIWFGDRYADTIILTPGNAGGVYQWMGSPDTAPALVSNAPTQVNYLFVSNNILVTLGAYSGGNPVENRVFASDQNDITNWTSSSTNQVFDDDIEGAGRLTSHCPVEDYNLLFTEYQTYTMRYIGLPFVWEIKPLDEVIGIIAPMARVSVRGMAFWMGQQNFHMYRGGTVDVIPANTQHECTALSYVFDDLNWGQKSKIFAWYNKEFNEVWFHYPSAGSNEPDKVVVVDTLDFTWTIHNFDRTAGEYPNVKQKNPYLANLNTLYKHEIGTDADGQPLEWILTSNRRFYGKDNINVNSIVPDSGTDSNITFTATGYRYPQSPIPMYVNTLTITPTTEFISITNSARFQEYTWTASVLGQEWQMGTWFEEVQKGPAQ